jgi:hypothetical protein
VLIPKFVELQMIFAKKACTYLRRLRSPRTFKWTLSALTRACSAKAESMGFDGIHGAFWIGDSTGIDSPLGGGRCRRPILLIFEVG